MPEASGSTLSRLFRKPQAPAVPAPEPPKPRSVEAPAVPAFDVLIESLPCPIFYKDTAGRYVGCNKAFADYLGRSREEIVGKTVYEMGPREVADRYHEKDRELFEQPGRQRYEWKVERRDGERRDVVFDKATYHDAEGGVLGLVGVITDVTDRNRAERALSVSETKYRQVFDLSPSVIMIVDANGTVEDVNPRMEDWLGYTHEDVVGRHIAQLPFLPWASKLKVMRAFNRRMSGHVLPPYDLLCQTKTGRPRTGSVVATPIRDDRGRTTGDLIMISDVTAQKAGEERRRLLEAQVRQRQRLIAVGMLAGGIAHEIDTPVNSILNCGQLLAEALAGNASLAGYAQEVVTESERIARVINNLRLFSEEQPLPPHPVAVHALVDSVLALCGSMLKSDGITIVKQIPADLPQLPCRVNPMRQVLMNLVANARDGLNEKYPDAHRGKRLTISASLVDGANGRCIRFSVEDTGIGVPPRIQQQVFAPFFTTRSPSLRAGLGLSVSQGIVADHGGEIRLESEAGRWTCVQVDIPLAADGAAPAP
jgi:PAS domain S-box-containing protein